MSMWGKLGAGQVPRAPLPFSCHAVSASNRQAISLRAQAPSWWNRSAEAPCGAVAQRHGSLRQMALLAGNKAATLSLAESLRNLRTWGAAEAISIGQPSAWIPGVPKPCCGPRPVAWPPLIRLAWFHREEQSAEARGASGTGGGRPQLFFGFSPPPQAS